jgi:HD-GYP domain-containing protein (c-di-GMP phosphodiesterase class II)
MAIFKETKIKTSLVMTLTLLFFFIGAIPLLISSWKLILISRDNLDKSLRENFFSIGSTVSLKIADFVNANRNEIRDFSRKAGTLNLKDSNEPPELMRNPNVLKVRILNLQGKGPYYSKMNFQDSAVPNLEFNAFSQAVKGTSYIGTPYYHQPDDVPILIFAEPIRNQNGELTGALSVILSLDPLWRIINEQSAGGRKVFVVDSNGILLLHPDRDIMQNRPDLSKNAVVSGYTGSKGAVEGVMPYKEKRDGKTVEILGSYSSVNNPNWGVIIQIEKGIALAPVNDMIRTSIFWGIVFALAACIAGIILARWISNPIKELAHYALDVGRHQNFDRKIELKASNEIQQLADTFNFMTDEIKQNILGLQNAAKENKELFMSAIRMLAAAIDAKDPYTRGHSERVKDYSLVIARQMGYAAAEIERVEIAALLHDVGKIGIDDRILRKPTNLTPEEFEVMKTHPDKGASILSQIAQLADIVPGTRSHHENYDGSGYPQGLKGDQIPPLARIITIADTFDAMTTDRPYQKAFTLEFALNRIRTMAGVKYDPKVVESFSRACEEGKVTLHKPSRPRPKLEPFPGQSQTAPVPNK